MQLGDGHGAVHYKQVDSVGEITKSTTYSSHEVSVNNHPALGKAVSLRCFSHKVPERESLAWVYNHSIDVAACEPDVVGLVELKLRVNARAAFYHVVAVAVAVNHHWQFFFNEMLGKMFFTYKVL
jgi:hypothetical protein